MIGTKQKKRITKFGYLGDLNNQIFSYTRLFGYLVNRVTRVTEFGDSGHPNKTEETKFGNNRPKPFGSLAKKWNLF
jgi:hypothetical protein